MPDLFVRHNPAQQQDELVAAQTGHDIAAAHSTDQPPGCLLQYQVTLFMAIGVIDLFESIQIHVEDSQQLPAGFCLQEQPGQEFVKQPAVGKSGECVVVCHMGQLFLRPLTHLDLLQQGLRPFVYQKAQMLI